tara:strand:+ start:336 stop:1175 length:840 start_codon:yes stop_codon:yes gene_type:complete
MVKLTSAQKKRLKTHSINQSATHMKKMISLMKDGASFSEAHKEASKPRQKQKQKQTQSQNVVVNLATPQRRTPQRRNATKPRPPQPPRPSDTPNTSRVLSQFIQPQQATPDARTMINPAPIPMPFMNPTVTAPRPPAVLEGRILGGSPQAPLVAPSFLNDPSPPYTPPITSGTQQPDTPATAGRKLMDDDDDVMRYQNILAATRGYESGGEGGGGNIDTTLTATDDETVPRPEFVRTLTSGSGGTVPLTRVDEEEDDDMFFGFSSPQGGTPSPSLMRRL